MARRNLLSLFLVLAPVLAFVGCHTSSPGQSLEASLRQLTPDEVQTRIAGKDGHTFIYDNNDQDRWAKGHVPGAKWLDPGHVTAGDLPSDKDATLIFYCANEH
jgi:hypothetical protein